MPVTPEMAEAMKERSGVVLVGEAELEKSASTRSATAPARAELDTFTSSNVILPVWFVANCR